jgi:hypothetical protein
MSRMRNYKSCGTRSHSDRRQLFGETLPTPTTAHASNKVGYGDGSTADYVYDLVAIVFKTTTLSGGPSVIPSAITNLSPSDGSTGLARHRP